MNPARLTDSQREAIGHPLADACVTASAGSGKTTVLTGRYLELVRRHRLPPRRVAALTFTDKAAAEMRRRIAEGFDAAGEERARDEVEFAPISTIHAYCARLLRVHAVDAGVDPAFAVLDEAEALLLREDAAVLAERQVRRTAPDDLAVLSRLGLSLRDAADLLECLRGSGRTPRDLAWHRGVGDPAALAAAVARALPAFETEGARLPDRWCSGVQDAAAAVRAALDESPLAPPSLAAAAAEVGAVRPGRPKAFTDARKALEAALDALEGALLDEEGARDVVPPLARLLAQVDDAYGKLKRERSALDFADLEILTLALLERLAQRGRRLGAPPAALLVDEVQDTNPLQARILERLRGPACPQFSVGDPKQSIYRFRRADVRVIAGERERVGEAGRRALPETFRARAGLVDVLNDLHARLFAGGAAGVPHEPMRPEGTFRDAPGPEVEIAVVDVGANGSAAEGRVREAAWIAACVRDLVAGGVPRAKVEEGRPPRVLGYGDVAILFRARGDLKVYEDALAAAGVPYRTHKGRGYFLAEEMADLLHVLRVVHDPLDRFALAAMATGPAVGATDADLLRWFGGPGEPFERMRAEARAPGRLATVLAVLEDLRREAIAGRLARVVEGALHGLGLLDAALLQPDGDRRGANLRKAVDVARGLERSGRHGLSDLLRRITLLRDREIPEAEAALGGEGDDVVRLMTVHAAKGLEFPVVILADAGRQPRAVSDPVLLDGEGGLASKLSDPLEGEARPSAGWTALQRAETREEKEEALRLLYVATTRAEERLVVAASQGKRDPLGWMSSLLAALGEKAWRPGDRRIGRGTLRVRVVDGDAVERFERPDPPVLAAPEPEVLARAEALLRAADEPTAPLGGTRYVVSVSELLAFAESPAAYRLARMMPPPVLDAAPPLPRDAEDAPDVPEEDLGAARRRERREAWDEPEEGAEGLSRGALGRAVHAVLERLVPGDGPSEEQVRRAVEEEMGPQAAGRAVPLVQTMVERFARSATGRALAQALSAGEGPRREVAFHARIRFPGRRLVGPFDALLVKGSIDLWLPDASGTPPGLWIVDHKTNPRTSRAPTPEALAVRYAWQLRLYALAAERILGTDVAGARLVLLDPSWGPEAVEVAVDVSGPALEEARRLCEAFAVAELEDRWPTDWRALLSPPGPRP